MGRQRNRPQRKGQENSPEEELDEIDAKNSLDGELRVMILGYSTALIKRHRNYFKKRSVRNKECNI